MANWQERIREFERKKLISAGEGALQKQRLETERIRLEEEARRKSDEFKYNQQTENNNLAEELESVLLQLGVSEKLKGISEELWKCGEIANMRDGNYIFASSAIRLTFRYDYDAAIPVGGTPIRSHTTEGGERHTSGGADHWEIGKKSKETLLEISMAHNKDPKTNNGARNSLRVYDSEYHREIERWNGNLFYFDLTSVNRTQLAAFLDNEILESCLYRQQTHALPLELKAKDEQSEKSFIKLAVPWHKRLFK